MHKPKISIIVPVYNAEKYLKECLNSLLNQTFQDIEILCINDGSTDSSLDILNAFKEKDDRIKVFSQENSGPARARNVGLGQVQGEYLMFCDADDTYEPEMCEKMYHTITENDVDFAMCDSNIIEENDDHGRNKGVLNYHHIKYFGHTPLTLWMRTKINVLLWNKIFKMNLIRKYQISFPDGYESDDNAFIWQYLSISSSFYGIEDKLYNYRLLNNSVMGKIYAQKKTEKLYDRVYAIKHFFNFLKKNNLTSMYPFLAVGTENSIIFVRRFLSPKNQIKFLKLLKQEVLDMPEIKGFLSGREIEYPLICACVAENYQAAILKKKQHFFAKILGNVKQGDKKRFYFLGIPIFKRKKTETEKKYYLLGIKVFETNKEKTIPAPEHFDELKTPTLVPEGERYILCFDCIYDKGQEAIDAWTFFKYLQNQKIPSKYVSLKGNNLDKEVQGMQDVMIINSQDEFYEKCGDIIRKSKCIITSFGLTGQADRCFRKLNYLNYIYIDHGSILLKKWVFQLYNPERFHKMLASNRLTYELYKERGWDDTQIVCAGMPRWDLLAHKENNGYIFVFFTWRKTFQKNIEFGSRYMAYIGEFLKKLRQTIPDTPIDIALHHETLRRDIKFPNLEDLNIRILPTSGVSKAIRESSMLITDYSSVFWDFIYMDKPVVFYRFDKDDMSLNQVDQEATISAMQEDKKLYNCLYEEKDVLEKVSDYVRNNFQIEPEIAAKNKTIFWESRKNCENLLKLINGEK